LIEQFAENITKRTDGKVTFRVFGPEIGDWTELERMAMKGAVDIQFNAWDTSLDERWNVVYLPFLASTWEQAREIYSKGGPFDELGKDWAKDANLYYLGTWLNNMASLGLKKGVITTPEGAKGVKVRCPPMDIFKCYVEKMGFTTVTIPWAETPTAISTGVAEGWVGSGAVYMYNLFRDVANTMIVTYDVAEMWSVTMNLDKWNELPQEYQTIIQEEADKIIAEHLRLVEAEEMEYQAKLIEHGWTVVDMAADHPEDLKVWKERARECWDIYEPIIGKEQMDKIKAMTE
jgi:TRAP-type C4-dicarboxylate transport system substrate-binding protein